MANVNYNHLGTFYALYQAEAITLDMAQKLTIDYLNKTVKKNEEQQPQPFSVKYIDKISLSLTARAVADKAEPIISAIKTWREQWFKQLESTSMQFKASTNTTSISVKMHAIKDESLDLAPNLSSQKDSHRPLKIHTKIGSVEESKVPQETPHVSKKEELLILLSKNCRDVIKEISANGDVEESYVSWVGENGENILHLAAEVSSQETLEYLTSLGISPELDIHGRNVLHYAAEKENINAIEYFCRVGEEHLLSTIDSNGYTPMHTAILKKSSDCFISMLSHVWSGISSVTLPSSEDNELHLAARNGFLTAFSQGLLHSKFKNILHNKNRLGETPLQIAIKEGHLGIVRLIYNTKNYKFISNEIQAAVELSRVHKHPLIFEYLTTMDIARAPTYEDLKAAPERIDELINAGLDINGLQNGRSMLHRAIEDDDLNLVMLLINKGGALITVKAESEYSCADVGWERGLPALYFAASLGRANIARYLNETFYGRNEFLKVNHGHTGNPIHLANHLGKGQQISRALLNRGWQ